MIKSEKLINRDGTVTYILYDGTKEIFRDTLIQNTLDEKLSILYAYSDSDYVQTYAYSPETYKKDVMRALGKVDDDLKVLYHEQYPWGGKRENSGRKKGSHNRNKRTERTEKLRNSITLEEKNLLKVVLKYYRENIATADSKIKEDFDINILRQLT